MSEQIHIVALPCPTTMVHHGAPDRSLKGRKEGIDELGLKASVLAPPSRGLRGQD